MIQRFITNVALNTNADVKRVFFMLFLDIFCTGYKHEERSLFCD